MVIDRTISEKKKRLPKKWKVFLVKRFILLAAKVLVLDFRLKFFLIVFPLFAGLYLQMFIICEKINIRFQFAGGKRSLKHCNRITLFIQENDTRNGVHVHVLCKLMHSVAAFFILKIRITEYPSIYFDFLISFCIKFYRVIILVQDRKSTRLNS